MRCRSTAIYIQLGAHFGTRQIFVGVDIDEILCIVRVLLE